MSSRLELERVETPDQQALAEYMLGSVLELAELTANDRPGELSAWGANFYFEVISRVAKMDSFLSGNLNLQELEESVIGRARMIDSGLDELHPPVWRINANGDKVQVKLANSLGITWAGLLAELPTFEVLRKLNLGREFSLIHSGEPTMLENFDRWGKADFILMRMGRRQELIGIQVKRHGGSEVTIFNGSDEESLQALKVEVERLKSTGKMNSHSSFDYSGESFATTTQKYLGSDYQPKMIYLLVGVTAIDRKSGLFHSGVREVVSEGLQKMIVEDCEPIVIDVASHRRESLT